jgi:hypothetical protein
MVMKDELRVTRKAEVMGYLRYSVAALLRI